MYSLKQAADAVGKSKATIHRDVKKGKISANKDGNGHYKIDPSELHRVYEPVSQETPQETPIETNRDTKRDSEIKTLRAELEGKKELLQERATRIEELKADKELIKGLITNQSDQTNREIEALRAKVEEAEVAKTKALKTARRWKEEANKPWYRKLFGNG